MEIWYFETSAVNWICDKLTAQDAIETKKLQLAKGREWVISPVGIKEILCTTNGQRRDELIYKSQRLFSKKLLISPEEMIIRYINKGFPMMEEHEFIAGNCDISNTWRDIVERPYKTMSIEGGLVVTDNCSCGITPCFHHKDHNTLVKKKYPVEQLNKMINGLLSDDVSIHGTGIESSIKVMIESEYSKLKFHDDFVDADIIKARKIAIFYIFFILCGSFGYPGDNVIDKFWMRHSLLCSPGRFRYAMDNFKILVYRGPLVLLSMMTVSQAKTNPKKLSRGLYEDSLHAMYAVYSDRFFTNDEHFIHFKEILEPHPIANRIYKINDMSWYKRKFWWWQRLFGKNDYF